VNVPSGLAVVSDRSVVSAVATTLRPLAFAWVSACDAVSPLGVTSTADGDELGEAVVANAAGPAPAIKPAIVATAAMAVQARPRRNARMDAPLPVKDDPAARRIRST
jgi:hypothetical protein